MADVFSKSKRSDIMSRVRGTGNKATELAMIAILRAHDIRGWRRHTKIFGNPDFVFPKHNLAMFVDGCFWHGCKTHGSLPAANKAFWRRKLARNKTRDQLVSRTLRRRGWAVLRIWQHELRRQNEKHLVQKILMALADSTS